MANDDRTAPLLSEDELNNSNADAMDPLIPSLNPEDPLFGLRSTQVAASREIFGANEILIPDTPLWKLFIKQFIGFLPLLIEIAAVISLAVQDWADFGIICGMLLVNACLGFHEEYKAKKSLDELSEQLESEIATRREGESLNLNVKELVPGDVVLLVGGTIVPADTQWIKGDVIQVDTAPLTGEPLPRKYPGEHGEVILAGTTVVAGECYGRVLRTGHNTEIGKAQADVLKDKTVRVVSVFQNKIMTVVQTLVVTSLVLVIAVLLVQGLQNDGFKEDPTQAILDALSILIASIPIALPLVLQVNLALGASFLAKHHHAIVTSIPALQDIASMSMLCSDKTGTLTTANMSVIEEKIYAADGFSNDDVIMYAVLCSNADKKDDPIDRAIVSAFETSSASSDGYTQTEIIGFNPTVKRVVSFVTDPSGATKTIAKGLPAKILDTEAGAPDDHELQWKVDRVNDKAFVEQVTSVDKDLSVNGYKTIAIAVCEGNARELGDAAVWKFAGLLPMLDPPRHDTPATIESLHRANISVKMITGDHANVGKETARLIGLGTNIYPGEVMRNAPGEEKNKMIYDADGFAAVLPSDKREIVMTLRNHFGLVTGMTGDGVNDAAALSAAHVGIAVEGATDAAKNAADLILTKSGLSPIYGAVLESRRIFARIKSYVVYRVAASLILVLTLSIIIFVKGCAVNSLFVIILALLNDVSMIPVAYDNASATTRPQLPKARTLVYQSAFYGLTHAALSLMFIFTMDYDRKLQYDIDLEQCSNETQGFIWFHLLLVTELMIFSVRAPGFFIFSMPSIYLVLSVFLTLVAGGLIACLANQLGLHGSNLGYIVVFNVGSFIVVDFLKIKFREMIGEEPGDIITSDELIEPPARTEAEKNVEKGMRYVVHQDAVVDPEDYGRVVEVRKRTPMVDFFDLGTSMNLNDGFVNKRAGHRTSLMMGNTAMVSSRPRRRKQMSSPL
eukprot:CAMPEP_0202013878 /NCGR_PEP_ID=MMETSP0905-20130828/27516_1 /ASSEMBLY_ACC=CAM_ASM_000554 /TAXON_ID=420261 /ORGANISM="Thalassiosira antarctica, Strain CCMP982" /LENGTH=961 /DNA_ID=CAMNT_0048573587 /DNA_START=185 /DNA_END=3070 /DNA_ORIENTATION=+